MTKLTLKTILPHLTIVAEDIELHYNIEVATGASIDQSSSTYPYVEIVAAVYDGRDVRAFLTTHQEKVLEDYCVDDYFKTLNREPVKKKRTRKKKTTEKKADE